MATKTEKVKSKLNDATAAYLAQLKSTHAELEFSDSESAHADRAAQIAYVEAHLDDQNA